MLALALIRLLSFKTVIHFMPLKNSLRLTILSLFFLPGFYCVSAQDNKPSTGDIGLWYSLNFNGAIQQQISVSGFLKKHIEFGSSISISVNDIRNTSNGLTTQPFAKDTLLNKVSILTKTIDYFIGVDPYLVYHFPIKSKVDLYAGGFFSFSITNDNTTTYTTYNGPYAFGTDKTHTYNVPIYTVGVGPMVGCRYFFYKRLALGVQAGLREMMNLAYGGWRQTNFTSQANATATLTYYFERTGKTRIID